MSRLRIPFFVIFVFASVRLSAALTAAGVAELVHEKDEAVLTNALREAITAPAPLVRATAARLVAIRSVAALLPDLRAVVVTEGDATAAREQIRALALLGTQEDVGIAKSVAAKWPSGMDNALALAVARRGGVPAIETYNAMLRDTRMTNAAEFFRVALWGRADAMTLAGARLIANHDERGWEGLLGALRHSNVAMHPPMLVASLGAPSEEIRSASVWYLIRGYSVDPDAIPAVVKESLATPRGELSSNREDFGRELLRRMAGGERRDDSRWTTFLESEEADELLRDEAVLQYLTDAEYLVRFNRCEVQTRECAMPRKRGRFEIPSQPVAPPAFDLPELLPAGLADAILKASGCKASWLGIADASVDRAGRIRALNLNEVVP